MRAFRRRWAGRVALGQGGQVLWRSQSPFLDDDQGMRQSFMVGLSIRSAPRKFGGLGYESALRLTPIKDDPVANMWVRSLDPRPPLSAGYHVSPPGSVEAVIVRRR